MDFKLKITNNCDSDIYFYDSFSYPDTSIRIEYNPIYSATEYLIKSKETKSVAVKGTWEGKFEIWDTLMIYIFDASTLEDLPWDTLRKDYLILKRYDLSQQDLENINWNLIYP
jgi:hypothetical protein